MSRLEKIRNELEEWKKVHPALVFSISTDDAEYILKMAEVLDVSKICKCP
jgi:hypothetical protein